jgi:HK97 family phage portal protein
MPPPRLRLLAREPTLTMPPRVKDAGTAAVPTPSMFWAFGGFPSSTGVPVSPLTAIQVATVYGCAKARAEDLAKVPLILRRFSGETGVRAADPRHPVARLLRRPNDWMTMFQFVRFIEWSLCYRGNAYAVIKRDAGGDPVQLVPIVPDLVHVEVSPKGTLYYRVQHPALWGTEQRKLHQDNVLHFRNVSLDGGYIGISPIAAAQEAIGLALAAQQHGATLFRQGAQVGGVLKHPNTLSNEAKDYITAAFAEKFAGVQNAHKVPVLEEGMTFEKVGMTNEDAQFVALRGFQRAEICAIFRVPPHKVMDLERATYSNMEVSEQAYINDALMPDAEQIAQEMRSKLLFEDELDDLEFHWRWDALLRADRKTRYEAHAVGLNNGFLNVNGVLDQEGQPRIGPEGDVYRVPLNLGSARDPANQAPTGTPGDAPPNPVPAGGGDSGDEA